MIRNLCCARTADTIPLKLQAWSVPEPDAELWVCENQVFRVQDSHVVPEEELRLCIQHVALKEQKKLHRIQHEVQAHHSSKSSKRVIRERIPDDVRLYVWQRDQGKCVQCGSQEKLEYDHIIPVSRGGGNTDRISNYSAKSTIAKKVS